ncbi:MAG: lysophospholipid acyltransferase family protein [Verrucomicrobiota bacterium]
MNTPSPFRWNLDLSDAIPLLRDGPGHLLKKPAEDLLQLSAMNRFLRHLNPQQDPTTIFQRALDLLALRYRMDHGSVEAIPTSGPVIVVANHPFGGADALVLAHLLAARRTDMRMLANSLLVRMEAVEPWLIGVDSFGVGAATSRRNIGPMKQAIAHLRNGGCLGVFPAGEVSAFSPQHGTILDKPWSKHVAALVRKTGATVVPICFTGANSWLFQVAGLMHPLLRTALLPHEFLRCQGKEIVLRIGKPLPASALLLNRDDQSVVDTLRLRVDLLGGKRRTSQRPRPMPNLLPRAWRKPAQGPEPVAPAGDPALLASEVAALPGDALLAAHGDLEVWIAGADAIPNILNEIGRLRELTFRDVSEGTGRARDLDAFDTHYRHLFLWNAASREIAGAYRMGLSDELLARNGRDGFYTHTLFRFHPAFLQRLGPSMELGRSFVTTAYQRKPYSLFLLWKGIGHFVARHPRYRTLFGPVSISSDYSMASRSLMVEFLRQHHSDPAMEEWVTPRNPFRPASRLRRQHAQIAAGLKSIDEVSSLVAGLEQDGKGLPVLLRQYVAMNAVLLKFNVDRHFCDALDGLVVVDLRAADPRMMTRYMGETGWHEFCQIYPAPARKTKANPALAD